MCQSLLRSFFLKKNNVGSSLAWHRNADLYAVAVLGHRHNCKIVVLMGSQLTATWIIEGPSLYCALFFSSQELAVYIRHINLFFMVTYAWMLDRITLSIWFSTSFSYIMGLIYKDWVQCWQRFLQADITTCMLQPTGLVRLSSLQFFSFSIIRFLSGWQTQPMLLLCLPSVSGPRGSLSGAIVTFSLL